MKLHIRHRTAYRFDRPVFLEPHVIRLRPRVDGWSWLLARHLDIAPSPAVCSEYLDAEGNVVTHAWFDDLTDHLTIEHRSTVETLVTDPFNFLLEDPTRTLADPYPDAPGSRLRTHRRSTDDVPAAVQALALAVAEGVEQRPERFPGALAARLQREIEVEVRHEGPPHAAEATLAARRGACRDLAVLFIECCRGVGLAARFVSGYVYVDGGDERELHAWAEVYLPGGGWRGYDPTHGLAVADRHVAVAAAADPSDAAPVSGTYRGSATATLETLVELAEVP